MRKRKKIHSILVVAGIVCLAGAVFHIVDTGRIFQKQTIIWIAKIIKILTVTDLSRNVFSIPRPSQHTRLFSHITSAFRRRTILR